MRGPLIVVAVCAVVLTGVVVLREVQHQADRRSATERAVQASRDDKRERLAVLLSHGCQEEIVYDMRGHLDPAGGGHCSPYSTDQAEQALASREITASQDDQEMIDNVQAVLGSPACRAEVAAYDSRTLPASDVGPCAGASAEQAASMATDR